MKTASILMWAPGALLLVCPAAAPGAQTDTAFTYQGQLKESGVPVDDACDFQFTLWDSPNGGSQVGYPVTTNGVPITNGLFTVTADFGSYAFTGDARWLEVAVQCPGDGGFTTLSPRQELTPVPYALALPGLWTQQNATSPNVVAGHINNSVDAGIAGAAIGGGGANLHTNQVTDNHGTIGGGWGNVAGDGDTQPTSAQWATVGGGNGNQALGASATVAGGVNNGASGVEAFVGGGSGNTAANQVSAVVGGINNLVNGYAAFIGAGNTNDATGSNAAVAGGYRNSADGAGSSVPGGYLNEAVGSYSLAAGRRAKALHTGTFVWADSTDADFASTAENQFLISAAGGVGINTNGPQAVLHLGGTPGVDGIMFPDGTLQTTAGGGGGAAWNLTGNAGTNPLMNFLGTTDDVALELRVNDERACGSNRTPPVRT